MAELAALAQPQPIGLPPANLTLTDAQLHGRACVHCGDTDGRLVPAGHRYTPDGRGRLGWAVAAHPEHLIAARYEAAQLPPDEHGRRPWAIINHQNAAWETDGEVVRRFPTHHSAETFMALMRYEDAARAVAGR